MNAPELKIEAIGTKARKIGRAIGVLMGLKQVFELQLNETQKNCINRSIQELGEIGGEFEAENE